MFGLAGGAAAGAGIRPAGGRAIQQPFGGDGAGTPTRGGRRCHDGKRRRRAGDCRKDERQAQHGYSGVPNSNGSSVSTRARSQLSRKAWSNARSARHSSYQKTRPSRSEEHTSELQSLMRISYAVFCLKKKNKPYKKPKTSE